MAFVRAGAVIQPANRGMRVTTPPWIRDPAESWLDPLSLTPDQQCELCADSSPDTACNMWQLGRTLIERRCLDGGNVGFMNGLGKVSRWRVGTPPPA
ncbi:MAG: hypothetical protein H7338_22325 [Candidatus Sericytochromatia bacterium]|nr:hypothetical protein [Candidatus Sericytochromatia bacterium]